MLESQHCYAGDPVAIPSSSSAAAAAAACCCYCWLLLLQPAAVLDWELATLGNPWADVAYLAMPYHLPPALASLALHQPLPGQW
jgi:hypothetical protein